MPTIYRLIAGHPAEKPLLLATIIETKGSTPQVTGAQALFDQGGLSAGTLGGGLVEANAAETAQNCLRFGRTALQEFDLSSDVIEGPDAVCGGWVSILFQPLHSKERSIFLAAAEDLENRKSGLLLTTIRTTGDSPDIERQWVIRKNLHSITLLGLTETKSAGYLERGSPLLLKPRPDLWLAVQPHFPKPKLIIAGAGHVGAAVAHLGRLLDFEVTVLDDRPDLANRISDAYRILGGDIAETLSGLPLAEDCFIVIVTRGHRHDAEALRACLGRNAAYIGMIGSARKIKLMRADFLAKKWATEEQLDAVFAPIGLDIDSTTVQEIAVSITAQLIHIRAKKMRQKEEKWFGP